MSTAAGSSFNLMKASAKRRRTKKQIEEEKKQEEAREPEIAEKMARNEQMEAEVNQMKNKVQRVDAIDNAVVQLKASGFLIMTGED